VRVARVATELKSQTEQDGDLGERFIYLFGVLSGARESILLRARNSHYPERAPTRDAASARLHRSIDTPAQRVLRAQTVFGRLN
jgi:hypothetical protein